MLGEIPRCRLRGGKIELTIKGVVNLSDRCKSRVNKLRPETIPKNPSQNSCVNPCMHGGFLCMLEVSKNTSFFELTMTGASSTVAAKTLRFLYAPPPESPLSVQNLPFATPKTFSIYATMVYCESHLRVIPCHSCRSCVLVC